MKKMLVIILVVSVLLFYGCSVKTENEISQVNTLSMPQSEGVGEGIENWEYPIKSWKEAQSSGLDYQGWQEACNPPEDVLHSLPTQELANLVLSYPVLGWMPSLATDSEANIFIGVFEESSDVFSELRNREDRNICILRAFAQNVPDTEAWDVYNQANCAEHFIEQYLFVFSKELTQEEKDFYLKTVEEKTKKFYCNIMAPDTAPGLSFDEDGTAYRKGHEGR